MLGNIALGCTDMVDDVLDADFSVTQGAKDLETQRMRHGFQRAGSLLDILIAGYQEIHRAARRIPLQASALVMRYQCSNFSKSVGVLA